MQDRPLSDTAIRKYLQDDMKKPGLTVTAFVSSFRDWAAERTNMPGEIAEAALGHVKGDETEAAYLRTDMLKRTTKTDGHVRNLHLGPGDFRRKKVVPIRGRIIAQ